MSQQSDNAIRIKTRFRPLAWMARTVATLLPNDGRASSVQAAHHPASGNFVESLPPLQEFHLVEELLESLGRSVSNSAFFQRLLAEVEAIVGAQGSLLYRLSPQDGSKKVLAATLEQPEHSLDELLELAHPLATLAANPVYDEATVWIHVECNSDEPKDTDDAAVEHCNLLLKLPADLQPDRWQMELLQNMAVSLCGIVRNLRRAHLDQQFIHSRERALIARELHDSLAQSLSFLKIQLTRLEVACRNVLTSTRDEQLAKQLQSPMDDLRKGVDLSYRQLRELINSFRLTMNGQGLTQALEKSVEEFENLSDMAFTLDNRLTGIELSVEEETHILLVAREALSNAVRHSQGTRTEASLWAETDGTIHMIIEDNGIGVNGTEANTNSHGLQIMQQRMQDLHGQLNIGQTPLGGTRIFATFQPQSRGKKP